jgi:DNA polymerase V
MKYMRKGSVNDGLVFHAGFPNAGEDRIEQGLSLDALAFRHRASTYLWQLEDDIPELGWQAHSIVVVDRALEPQQNDLVVAVANEEFVVRKMHKRRLYDMLGRPEEAENVSIWGVITYVLQGYRAS